MLISNPKKYVDNITTSIGLEENDKYFTLILTLFTSLYLIYRLLHPRQQRPGLSIPFSPALAGKFSYNSNGDRVCILPIDIYENERQKKLQHLPKFSTFRRKNDPVYYQSRLLLQKNRRRSLLLRLNKKKRRKSKGHKNASLASMNSQKSFFSICSLLPNCIKKNTASRPNDVNSDCDSSRRKDKNKGRSTRISQIRSERILNNNKKSPAVSPSSSDKEKNAAARTIHATSNTSSRYNYY